MKQAPQRTVKAEWKRELGAFRWKTTVYLSGCSILSILPVNRPVVGQPGVLHLDVDGIEQVIRRELHAIAPIETLAEFDGHLGVVGIVDRLLGCQGIIPYAVDARIRVDVPQRIQGQLLEAASQWSL